jgi:hypothetical protein
MIKSPQLNETYWHLDERTKTVSGNGSTDERRDFLTNLITKERLTDSQESRERENCRQKPGSKSCGSGQIKER